MPSSALAAPSIGALVAAGLGFTLTVAVLCWLVSLQRRDASLADRIWAPMIVGAGWVYALLISAPGLRLLAMLGLASAWALRLSIFITWRNWGHGEDRRYQAMRQQHGARFGLYSLLSVFGLQAVLASVVSAPFLAVAVIGESQPLGWLDALGLSLAAFGLVYEAVADAQLARFKAHSQPGQVMDRGLWRHTRHPNYFGECCVWWGLGLMALACGWAAAWSLVSPLLMTVLLLRVSGVRLLEQDIADRRPAYRDYVIRTPAFIPGPLRAVPAHDAPHRSGSGRK